MTFEAFKAQVMEQLAEAELESLGEWERERPGEHLWASYRGVESCALCGVCRRRDDKNNACKGIVKVSLR